MGTTVTALQTAGDSGRIAHVGDSRAYLLREGALQQLTQDHTLVQQMVDEGNLDAGRGRAASGAEHHDAGARRRRPTSPSTSSPSTCTPGDRILLCSDGLTGMVAADDIRDLLERETERPGGGGRAGRRWRWSEGARTTSPSSSSTWSRRMTASAPARTRPRPPWAEPRPSLPMTLPTPSRARRATLGAAPHPIEAAARPRSSRGQKPTRRRRRRPRHRLRRAEEAAPMDAARGLDRRGDAADRRRLGRRAPVRGPPVVRRGARTAGSPCSRASRRSRWGSRSRIRRTSPTSPRPSRCGCSLGGGSATGSRSTAGATPRRWWNRSGPTSASLQSVDGRSGS